MTRLPILSTLLSILICSLTITASSAQELDSYDQPFGNVYPVPLIAAKQAPGAVPDHVDRLVLYDILANRISKDPHYIGVDFCAVLFDQSHGTRPTRLDNRAFTPSTASARSYPARPSPISTSRCSMQQELKLWFSDVIRAPHALKLASTLSSLNLLR